MKCPSRALIVVLLAAWFAAPAFADDFSFNLPQLTGLYHGEHANRHVDLDLGMPFAQIDGVSLRLVGEHTPGVIQLLAPHAPEEPYPAEVIGYFPEAGPSFTTAFDEILPPVAGPFDVTFHFDNLRHHGGGPNFEPLLDGHARLNVSAGGPPVIAIYAIKSMPFIDVEAATLIVTGQAGHGHPMLPGDYDQNGLVDQNDFSIWRATWGSSSDLRADGNGDGMIDAADYAVWRRNLGTTVVGAEAIVAVPEPKSATLLALGAIVFCRRWRINDAV